MRTLANLNVPKDTAARFPFGTIQNETDTQDGTPVVRELYGDIITNLYKLLEVTKVTPTGDEDSDDTQYQIIDALRKLTNTHNDIEQVITLAGTVWTIGLDLEILPNRYVFIGRAAEAYVPSVTYSFKGSGIAVLPASSPTGFAANDEVLTIVDTAGVRMYSLTKLTQTASANIITSLGAPIGFNDTETMYYFESGRIYTDAPAVFDIEETLQTNESNPALVIADVIAFKGNMLALVFHPGTVTYKVFAYDLTDLNAAPSALGISGITVPVGTDNMPYMYCDGSFVYFTNEYNNSVNDNVVSKFDYDEGAGTLTFVSSITLINGNFTKTTNAVLNNDKIYTFINNELVSYDLTSAASADLFSNFTLFYGSIFKFNGIIYYSRDEVATQWNL